MAVKQNRTSAVSKRPYKNVSSRCILVECFIHPAIMDRNLCIAKPTLPSVYIFLTLILPIFRVLDTYDCLHVPGIETYCTRYLSDIMSRQILFRLHVIKFGFIVKHCFLYLNIFSPYLPDIFSPNLPIC